MQYDGYMLKSKISYLLLKEGCNNTTKYLVTFKKRPWLSLVLYQDT